MYVFTTLKTKKGILFIDTCLLGLQAEYCSSVLQLYNHKFAIHSMHVLDIFQKQIMFKMF